MTGLYWYTISDDRFILIYYFKWQVYIDLLLQMTGLYWFTISNDRFILIHYFRWQVYIDTLFQMTGLYWFTISDDRFILIHYFKWQVYIDILFQMTGLYWFTISNDRFILIHYFRWQVYTEADVQHGSWVVWKIWTWIFPVSSSCGERTGRSGLPVLTNYRQIVVFKDGLTLKINKIHIHLYFIANLCKY